ncbi:Fic/DOC family protein [Candidatus Electrothrix aarhusensis]|uniref:Fic/DOC family protein n=1 Tax=Candidatus Electrothrix aarhusensis TaxID=1859131 RepID=A0A444IZ34_9BACT|nr:Fic/DOC family protein [Candidatus Electrothrix aarhusensis]
MNHQSDSHDRAHFRELLEDFPVPCPPVLDIALRTVHARFDQLNTEKFIHKLGTLDPEECQKLFIHLPGILHGYLFEDIFANAGLYRQIQDPNNGIIFFGPRQQFQGTPPEGIKGEIQQAVSHLIPRTNKPVYQAIKFYQQFVRVHPFYDANGRIGRFLLEIFLNLHGIGMQWKKLYANEKWIKKLNDCQRRKDVPEYERYLGYLVSHWNQCTFYEGSCF